MRPHTHPPQPFEWRGSQHPGLRYADLSVGRGRALAPGDSVSLHFEARYPALRGTVAASSREARTLGANRTLAEPFATAWPGGVPPELSRPRPARPTRPSVGLTLRPADADSADAGLFIVTDVVAGGPAARGGVRPLDRLLAVAGAPAGGLTPAQLGALLNAGEAGSEVTLTLRAAGGGGGGASASAVAAPRDVSLLRENLPVPRPAAAPAGGPAGADSGRGGGGLYVGGVGPKPPPGLWAGLAGMRVGGRRTLLVPPELAYEDGYGEVPPGGAVSLDVELLSAEPQA